MPATAVRGHFWRTLAAGGFGCVAAGALALRFGSTLRLGPAYPFKAAFIFAGMTIAALTFRDEHPFPALGPANRVTIVRAAFVAMIGGLIAEPATPATATAAVAAATLVALLDGVDGWLARRTGMASPFGARIDMETDALLILVMSILVWQYGKAGPWILSGGLFRYAFGAAAWPLPWMGGRLTPTMRGKAAAVAHMAGLIVALAPFVPWPASALVAGATLAALAWSFAVDVRRLWRQRAAFSASRPSRIAG